LDNKCKLPAKDYAFIVDLSGVMKPNILLKVFSSHFMQFLIESGIIFIYFLQWEL